MPFTTSLLTNTRATGTAVTNAVVNVRNLDQVASATVIVQVFAVSAVTLTLSPVYQTGLVVPANSAVRQQFNIAGNIAYEVQLSIITPLPNALLSVFGVDEFNNLVTGQRVLQSELTEIPVLTPIEAGF
ncbi:hypothetical protein [Paenibacillus methanolicus]|uniref:Uncharacterized protein n=1 Tax=Paenibacillus methanolicus TaxID=582686 RepID=A0A5S5BVC5_9BACL|nr:hypothetical protein [Paenibacillus methanolicus]TYP70120.1 hypothetical protein BCM02_11298 [Paenibacillus methanolicus]